MDFLGNEYYTIHQQLLLFTGLWPYKKSKLTILQNIYTLVLFTTALVLQITKIFVTKYDINEILTHSPYIIVTAMYIVKYCTFCCQNEKIKLLFECVKHDWNDLQRNENELSILRNCTHLGKLFTFLLMMVISVSLVIFTVIQFLPQFLDIVIPLNESRSRELPIRIECFNQSRCHYLALFYILTFTILGAVVILATETTYVIFTQHAVALFTIAGSRIEHSLDHDEFRVSSIHKNIVTYLKVVDAVNMHRRTLAFIESLSNAFVLSYTVMISLSVVSLIINLVYIFRAIIIHDIPKCLLILLTIMSHLFIMFFGNYTVQKLLDYNAAIFYHAYNAKWYEAPVWLQKLYLFLMLNTTINIKVVLFFFAPSIEGFSRLMNLSFTYFMVLYSTQMAK